MIVVVLPDPLGPSSAEDLPLVDLEVERLQGLDLGPSPEVAVDLGKVPCLDNDVAAHHEVPLITVEESRDEGIPLGIRAELDRYRRRERPGRKGKMNQ